MKRTLSTAIAYLIAGLAAACAYGQTNNLWTNPGLARQGMAYGEMQLVLRSDMTQCHGAAYQSAREAGLSDQQRKALGVALFNRCMADKGWSVQTGPRPRKPPAKPGGETPA